MISHHLAYTRAAFTCSPALQGMPYQARHTSTTLPSSFPSTYIQPYFNRTVNTIAFITLALFSSTLVIYPNTSVSNQQLRLVRNTCYSSPLSESSAGRIASFIERYWPQSAILYEVATTPTLSLFLSYETLLALATQYFIALEESLLRADLYSYNTLLALVA